MVNNRWVYKYNKTPTEPTMYNKKGQLRLMTNGRKNIVVDSMYTDAKLKIKKKRPTAYKK